MPTVTRVSPLKYDKTITIPSPPGMNAIRVAMASAPEADRSWDVGELQHTSEGYIATRPRREERPEARRVMLGHYMRDAAQHREAVENIFQTRLEKVEREIAKERQERQEELKAAERQAQKHIFSIETRFLNQTESIVESNNTTELYEIITRSLQGLNDLIFDVYRQGDKVLTSSQKEILKSNAIGYISRLLDPPQNLPDGVDEVRIQALSILSPQQLELCRGLLKAQKVYGSKRHILHHPRPDRSTAVRRVQDFLDDGEQRRTLIAFISSNPTRIPSGQELTEGIDDEELLLFAPEETYINVASQKVNLESIKDDRADTKAYLEALETL
ncbi:hypothetical protein C8J57DRAFT_1464558 [Mycena rebaudengoi]|nr:hypothetical protein C8J57DRAFT_1464558 [Mycena rebaudengoi]